MTDNAGLTHNLFYAQGSFDVEINGLDMTRPQFFAILGTLVDGQAHPAVVVHLQSELDAP